jgi:alkanesulfonate monooxygenase SsuD/methylene tetrahydromethanopterin reductase-like flavin-dependent oxidoreductase (luciferase family)
MESGNICCGIAIPQSFDDLSSAAGFLSRYLQRAEALGYEGGWVQEQIVGDAPILEPVTLITYAAALTAKLRLGTSVLITVIRNPVQLAKSLASLDQLSNGRIIVGVGVGGPHIPEAVFGVASERRGQRFVEGFKL